MVAGVWKYDIKYSISALFWSQLPQTDTPHCVCVWGGCGWRYAWEGRKRKMRLKKNKEKHLKTLSITVCYLE